MDDIFLPGHRAPILLLHGLRGNPMELQLLAQRLHAAGHTVSVPYLPGYGQRSGDKTPIGSHAAWKTLAHEQLNRLERDYGPAIVGGICIGADLALQLALDATQSVAGLMLISTTLYYDGWNLPWYRWLLPLAGPTPLKHCYSLREQEPYGVKNERIRQWIARQMENTGNSSAGARDLPLSAIYEAYRLMRQLRRRLSEIRQPALVLHAAEDEVASLRTPELLAKRLGSSTIEKIIFTESYHMLTMDNDREAVARACIAFAAKLPLPAGQATLRFA
jgi:carboxylesterase